MNVIVISGELVKDPVTHNKPGFTSLLFQIENKTGYGQYEKKGIFNAMFSRKKMGSVAKYLTAGRKVTVRGELVQQTYNSAGKTTTVMVIDVKDIDLGGNKNQQNQAPAAQDAPFNDFDSDPEPQVDDNPFGA